MSATSPQFTVTAHGTVSFADGAEPHSVDEGETVLLAGLRAGLPLPYECASGGCGTCKVRLVAGRVAALWEDAPGLSERDRRRGDRILMCQSLPVGDCQIRIAGDWTANARVEPTPGRRRGTLLERRLVTADTAVFRIALSDPIDYLPGQFVHLEFDDGVRRAYSMTQALAGESVDSLELLIRAKPEGSGTGWLFDRLRPGDHLGVEGPYGRAYAQSPPDRPAVCLAGGTGIAPILAIADSLLAASPTRSLAVYVGARGADDLVFAERLGSLRARGADVVVAVDRGSGRDHDVFGTVRTGMVLDHLAADVPDLGGHDVYLAGPPPMVEAALRRLVREGTASADRVFMDKFL